MTQEPRQQELTCPKCGSKDIGSDAELDAEGKIKYEYKFCWNCGHNWPNEDEGIWDYWKRIRS